MLHRAGAVYPRQKGFAMTTRTLIDRLPAKVRYQLGLFIMEYQNEVTPKDQTRASVSGYAKGLRDAGLITDMERGMLCVYCSTASNWQKMGKETRHE